MNIFKGLEQIVEKNYPLAQATWFGLGGAADYMITPENLLQFSDVIKRCGQHGVPVYMLGFGSNLLVRDEGVRGAVVKLAAEEFTAVNFNGDSAIAYAGADLNKLVLDCVRKGLGGLEALAGIPGTVGGAVRMNAGGHLGDFGSAIESVMLLDNDGNIFKKAKPELSFDYRSTNIKAKYIVSAEIKLSPADSQQLLKTVKEVWIYKKNTQPLNTRNAGCVFKNPKGKGLSAGAMIDRAGLKGEKIGGAVVSDKHANFIIAQEGCKSGDVLALIEKIKTAVNEKYGVDLELEIQIW